MCAHNASVLPWAAAITAAVWFRVSHWQERQSLPPAAWFRVSHWQEPRWQIEPPWLGGSQES